MAEFNVEEWDESAAAPSPEGESLTVERAITNLQSGDSGSRYYAAWWLGRFRVRTPEAVNALIAALSDETDRPPDGSRPLRRNAARALGKLKDKRAVPALIECLDCSDYYAQEAAIQALGQLGERTCVPKLMEFLAAHPTLTPHSTKLAYPYDAILEALGALKATEALALIEPFLQHSVTLVQYAAARAMYQLTGRAVYADRLIEGLSNDKLQLRRAALADLGAIGYLDAAEPVAQTLAENSLKLIALKGILERRIDPTHPSRLSGDAIRVMTLMDDLL